MTGKAIKKKGRAVNAEREMKAGPQTEARLNPGALARSLGINEVSGRNVSIE